MSNFSRFQCDFLPLCIMLLIICSPVLIVADSIADDDVLQEEFEWSSIVQENVNEDDEESLRLTVNRNLSLNDSTSRNVGNIIKGGRRFIHNFGTNNTFVGTRSGNFTTSGDGSNVGLGAFTLRAITTGAENTAIGFAALEADTAGNGNTAVGALSLNVNVTGVDNVAIGRSSLSRNTGSENVGIGANTLAVNTAGNNNTAIGTGVLIANTTGNDNTVVGYKAMAGNVSGSDNTVVGSGAMATLGTSGNTAIGSQALSSATEGVNNTVIGSSAGDNAETISNCIFIGHSAGTSVTLGTSNIYIGSAGKSTGNNNIYIANDGDDVLASNNGVMLIGGASQTSCFISGIYNTATISTTTLPVVVSMAGQLGTRASSRQFKKNINAMNNKSERIFDLNPVTFVYKGDDIEQIQYGLIAEEVDEIFPELVAYGEDGKPYTVHYEILPVLLLNEMKKQRKDIAKLKQIVKALRNKA